MKKIIITLSIVFTITGGIIGGAYYAALYKMAHRADTHDLSNRIGELSQRLIDEKNASNLVIGILKNGKIYTQGYGILDTLTKQPPTDSTIFGAKIDTLSLKTMGVAIEKLQTALVETPQNWQTYTKLAWLGVDDITWYGEQKGEFYSYLGVFKQKKIGVALLCATKKQPVIEQFAIDVLLLCKDISN